MTTHVVSVADPYQLPGHGSADGTTAFAEAALDVHDDSMPVTATNDLLAQVRAASHDGVTFALGGGAVNTAETPGGGASDGIGMGAALIVLLIAFGSVLAAVLPLVTAIFGIGVGLAGAMLLNHVVPSPGFTPILAAMIWAGVIARRRVLAVTGASVILLVLAAPALGMRLSMPDASTQPHGTSAYASHRMLADGFGEGYDAPLFIVASPAVAPAVADAVRGTVGVASVTPPPVSNDGAEALIVA